MGKGKRAEREGKQDRAPDFWSIFQITTARAGSGRKPGAGNATQVFHAVAGVQLLVLWPVASKDVHE